LALLGKQILAWIGLLAGQMGRGWLPVAAVGLTILLRRMRDWGVFSLVLFLTMGLSIIGLLTFPVTPRDLYLVRVFFIPTFAVMALWLGLGSAWLAERIMVWADRRGGIIPARGIGIVLGILIPLLAVGPMWQNFSAADHSRERAMAQLGRGILDTMEPGGVLFTGRDTPTFAVGYARIVEGLRPDVSLKHTGSGDIFRWLMPPPVPVDPVRRPLYGTLPEELPDIPGWSPDGLGILYQLQQESIETSRLLEVWEAYRWGSPDHRRLQRDFFLRELYRNTVAARCNLAQELARREEFDLALHQAKVAVGMDSTFYGPYVTLGDVYLSMSRHDQAIEACQTARRLAPGQARVYNGLGLALKGAGRDQEASRSYRRAIDLDARFADPLRNLGVLLAYRLDDPAGAIELWKRYLQLRPDDPEAASIRAEIHRLRQTLQEECPSEVETPTGEGKP
jgi:tetratricopeptide (TPR) repeat protein